MKERPLLLLFWMLLLSFSRQGVALAQEPSAVSLAVEASAYRGFLWKHTPRLTIRTGHSVWGFEIGVLWPTWGKRPWEARRQYPIWGVGGSYIRLGERAHCSALGLLPHLSIPIYRNRRWLTAFRIGTGVGYVTRPYDSFHNPTENAIGSHWNNLTQFRLGLTYRLNKHWRLQVGASLTHLSNGATKLPNFGTNIPAYFFSLNNSPGGILEESFRPKTEAVPMRRRWGLLFGGSAAVVEYAIIDGPKYMIWGGTVTALFHIASLNRLTLSVEGEYNPAVAEFGLQTGGFFNVREAKRGARRAAVAPGAEFLFGPVGIHLQAGWYTGRGRINRYVPAPWYGRLTTRYYLPPLFSLSVRPWAGVALKAHRVNAEMIALQLGLTL